MKWGMPGLGEQICPGAISSASSCLGLFLGLALKVVFRSFPNSSAEDHVEEVL
jgi:hypothetical protein